MPTDPSNKRRVRLLSPHAIVKFIRQLSGMLEFTRFALAI
jgi:hypothetical protein